MIRWLDWRARFYVQEALNWSGRKFGATRRRVIVECSIPLFAQNSYCISLGHATRNPVVFVMALCLAFTLGAIVSVFLENLRKHLGEESNWKSGRIWRLICWFGIPVNVVAVFVQFRVEYVIHVIGLVAFFVLLYVGACVEAPPRERTAKLAVQGA